MPTLARTLIATLSPVSAGRVLRGLRSHLGQASSSCIALLLEVVIDGLRVSPPAVTVLLKLCTAAPPPLSKWDVLLLLSLLADARHATAAANVIARTMNKGSLHFTLLAECTAMPCLVAMPPTAVAALLAALLSPGNWPWESKLMPSNATLDGSLVYSRQATREGAYSHSQEFSRQATAVASVALALLDAHPAATRRKVVEVLLDAAKDGNTGRPSVSLMARRTGKSGGRPRAGGASAVAAAAALLNVRAERPAALGEQATLLHDVLLQWGTFPIDDPALPSPGLHALCDCLACAASQVPRLRAALLVYLQKNLFLQERREWSARMPGSNANAIMSGCSSFVIIAIRLAAALLSAARITAVGVEEAATAGGPSTSGCHEFGSHASSDAARSATEDELAILRWVLTVVPIFSGVEACLGWSLVRRHLDLLPAAELRLLVSEVLPQAMTKVGVGGIPYGWIAGSGNAQVKASGLHLTCDDVAGPCAATGLRPGAATGVLHPFADATDCAKAGGLWLPPLCAAAARNPDSLEALAAMLDCAIAASALSEQPVLSIRPMNGRSSGSGMIDARDRLTFGVPAALAELEADLAPKLAISVASLGVRTMFEADGKRSFSSRGADEGVVQDRGYPSPESFARLGTLAASAAALSSRKITLLQWMEQDAGGTSHCTTPARRGKGTSRLDRMRMDGERIDSASNNTWTNVRLPASGVEALRERLYFHELAVAAERQLAMMEQIVGNAHFPSSELHGAGEDRYSAHTSAAIAATPTPTPNALRAELHAFREKIRGPPLPAAVAAAAICSLVPHPAMASVASVLGSPPAEGAQASGERQRAMERGIKATGIPNAHLLLALLRELWEDLHTHTDDLASIVIACGKGSAGESVSSISGVVAADTPMASSGPATRPHDAAAVARAIRCLPSLLSASEALCARIEVARKAVAAVGAAEESVSPSASSESNACCLSAAASVAAAAGGAAPGATLSQHRIALETVLQCDTQSLLWVYRCMSALFDGVRAQLGDTAVGETLRQVAATIDPLAEEVVSRGSDGTLANAEAAASRCAAVCRDGWNQLLSRQCSTVCEPHVAVALLHAMRALNPVSEEVTRNVDRDEQTTGATTTNCFNGLARRDQSVDTTSRGVLDATLGVLQRVQPLYRPELGRSLPPPARLAGMSHRTATASLTALRSPPARKHAPLCAALHLAHACIPAPRRLLLTRAVLCACSEVLAADVVTATFPSRREKRSSLAASTLVPPRSPFSDAAEPRVHKSRETIPLLTPDAVPPMLILSLSFLAITAEANVPGSRSRLSRCIAMALQVFELGALALRMLFPRSSESMSGPSTAATAVFHSSAFDVGSACTTASLLLSQGRGMLARCVAARSSPGSRTPLAALTPALTAAIAFLDEARHLAASMKKMAGRTSEFFTPVTRDSKTQYAAAPLSGAIVATRVRRARDDPAKQLSRGEGKSRGAVGRRRPSAVPPLQSRRSRAARIGGVTDAARSAAATAAPEDDQESCESTMGSDDDVERDKLRGRDSTKARRSATLSRRQSKASLAKVGGRTALPRLLLRLEEFEQLLEDMVSTHHIPPAVRADAVDAVEAETRDASVALGSNGWTREQGQAAATMLRALVRSSRLSQDTAHSLDALEIDAASGDDQSGHDEISEREADCNENESDESCDRAPVNDELWQDHRELQEDEDSGSEEEEDDGYSISSESLSDEESSEIPSNRWMAAPVRKNDVMSASESARGREDGGRNADDILWGAHADDLADDWDNEDDVDGFGETVVVSYNRKRSLDESDACSDGKRKRGGSVLGERAGPPGQARKSTS